MVLIGCVKTKTADAQMAADLYISPLFVKRRGYADACGLPWFILSARHGLVAPWELLEPYDVALAEQSRAYCAAWGEWVTVRLEEELGGLAGLTIEVHAGSAYVDCVRGPLLRRGASLFTPLEGLRQGEQLAWYGEGDVPVVRDPVAPIWEATASAVLAPSTGRPTATVGSTAAVVAGLLEFGATRASATPSVGPSFTPHTEANQFLLDDPFAFLVGVIFDQGIVAERAWEAPYFLRERLGHLDPSMVGAESEAVQLAVATPPMLHRFINNVPGWVSAARRMVERKYGGDAANIWASNPTAKELLARLDAFPGIGQKKAAMAVEMLAKDLDVPVRELSGSDIAYDVHVRRVFLRTGLAQWDDLDHMVDVARRLYPARPGALDAPAWFVGREWCHASRPDCGACPLGAGCPRLISAADQVRGN